MSVKNAALNDEQMDEVAGGTVIPYVVQSGDSLQAIAKRFNVSQDQLVKWNHIDNPNLLMVGQQLKIKF